MSELSPPLPVETDLLLRKHPTVLTVASAEWIVFGGVQPLGAQDALRDPGCEATQNVMPGDGM